MFNKIYSQKVNIVFEVFPWTLDDNPNWITSIKDEWGANTVELEIPWLLVEKSKDNYNFNKIYKAIDTVLAHNLKLSFRVRMGNILPDWINPNNIYFSKDDFNIDHEGNIIGYNDSSYYLNITSKKSINFLKNHYKIVLDSISNYLKNKIDINFVEFIPSIDKSCEMEFKYNDGWIMTGYSNPEIIEFRNFLKKKYKNINELKKIWIKTNNEPDINRWDDINPRNYDWHEYENKLPNLYDYPQGRVDWLEYKYFELDSMINTFSEITGNIYVNGENPKMGVQLGSLHDYRLDFRGFLDPTSFLKNTYAFRIADIKGYPFHFGADYARSICKYWNWKDGKPRYFSSEINDPLFGYKGNFNNIDSIAYYIENELVPSWIEQIRIYHKKGADKQVIYGWGNSQAKYFINSRRVNHSDFVNKDDLINKLGNSSDGNSIWNAYSRLRSYLKNYLKDQNIISYHENDKAVHLSSIYFIYSEEVANRKNSNRFPLYNSIKPKLEYTNPTLSYDTLYTDIITNYMLDHSIDYLNNYKNINLTESSKYLSDKTYLAFLKKELKIDIVNSTSILDNGHSEFLITPGLWNEYNKKRSPIHLVWRSRHDLQLLFPNANLPDYDRAKEINWSLDKDFIYWVKYYGTGYNNESKREYPDWNIYSEDSIPYYFYDKKLVEIWRNRQDLMDIFTNGHNKSVNEYPELNNILDWAIFYGYKESDNLKNYHSWPYIGTYSTIYASIPYSTSFENGIYDNWITLSSNQYGRIITTKENNPHFGEKHLTMDVNSNGHYCLNEAKLYLNLEGLYNLNLEFWWKDFNDEYNSSDAIYFSDDNGKNFKKVLQLNPTNNSNNWEKITINIDSAATMNGLYFSNNFVIKFQQYDNYKIPTDGFAFDDIQIYKKYKLTKPKEIGNNSDISYSYFLYDNYPNPFNSITNIKYSLSKTCKVKILIYNSLGEKIVTLVNKLQPAGIYVIPFNAINYSSGIYFIKLITNEYNSKLKILLIK